MIIQEGKIVYDKDGKINRINTSAYDIYYKGLIFVSGKKCGRESIEYIITDLLKQEDLRFHEIFGNYFIYIVDYKNKKQYIFTDNSGIFKAYKYKNGISTSFLELVDYFDEITIENLDYNSISEFFHFGFSYFENTFIKEIKRIDANDFFVFENGNNQLKEKKINPINTLPCIKIENFYADLIYAIKDIKTSLDLTGGFDSRLILSFFNKAKATFELAISGLSNNSDINIARKIATIIKKDFFPTFHSTEQLTAKDLLKIFTQSDSQIDIIDYHRNSQLNQDRLSRNVEIQISGAGGELYKDFWWLQDFPFYNNKKTNLEKLYNYRIESSVFPHSILSEKLKKHSLTLKENTISRLKTYVLDKNTQSYDNIYFNYKMKTNAGVYISTANNYFISYAPLLELEVIKIGYNLNRKERFFNNYHRKLISKNCPEISRIRTTEGITSSSSLIDLISDIIYYVFDKLKRLLKQILRKVFNKTYLQETPTDNYIYTFWKSNVFYERYVKLLKEINILNNEVDHEKIPENFIGKIITLGLLIDRLKK